MHAWCIVLLYAQRTVVVSATVHLQADQLLQHI